MIRLRLATEDLERTRFDFSPLVEVVQSGRMLFSGSPRPPHREWYTESRVRVRALDTELLALVLPRGGMIADFLVKRPGHAVTVEQHLQAIAEYPGNRLRDDLLTVWPGRRPPQLAALLDDRCAGRRIADVLHGYWTLLIEPHWRRMKSVLRDDVAYRATRLAADGLDGMLADLHHELSVVGATLVIDKPHHHVDHRLAGAGLCLVPSVFSWPELICTVEPGHPADITYGCRAAATVWDGTHSPDDPLGALLGRTRADLLRRLEHPSGTSGLAALLGVSAPAISQHLGVLRRAGMVTSYRTGRQVLHQRSALATSLLAATED